MFRSGYIFYLTSLTRSCLYSIKCDVITIIRFSIFCMTKQMPSPIVLLQIMWVEHQCHLSFVEWLVLNLHHRLVSNGFIE